MGRKKIEIDWKKVDNALMAGANGVQVAAMLGIHYDTLSNHCKEVHKTDFSDYLRQKREKGNNLLHAKQYELAMKGDRGMLIWLGKQRLEQSDKNDIKQDDREKEKDSIDYNQLSDDELRQLIELRKKLIRGGAERDGSSSSDA